MAASMSAAELAGVLRRGGCGANLRARSGSFERGNITASF